MPETIESLTRAFDVLRKDGAEDRERIDAMERRLRDLGAEEAIKAAARYVVDTVANLLEVDPHSWSARPCPTCRPIGALLGRPFGCYAYAIKRAAERKTAP